MYSICYQASCFHVKQISFAVRAVKSTGTVNQRLKDLEIVDEELKKGNDRTALSFTRDLLEKPDGLKCFGTARQVPFKLYTLDELKLNGIDTTSFLSPVDITLGSIERNLQITAALFGISAWYAFGLSQQQLLYITVGVLFLWSLDLIGFNGGVYSLALDTVGHKLSRKYRDRVIEHEAGHFLIAYLLGVLPKGYTLSSLEAFTKEGSLNVQAGTAFVDYEFVEEVDRGKVSAKMLNKFSCIALAGVATEYLLFGYSEGGLSDIYNLDNLLKSLGFTQKKADSQVRWAVLNTVLLLRRHEKARSELAKAMALRKSVGYCIDVIEREVDLGDL